LVASVDRSPLEQCEQCGSRLPADAEWCGLCLARVPRAPDAPAHPLAVGTPPPVARAPSRRREGALTFGITGRIVITVIVALVGVGGLLLFLIPYFATHSHLSLAYAAIFLGPYAFGAFLVLRDVWKPSWEPLEVLQEHEWKPPAPTHGEDA
jgi:hypothetical protein